MMLKRISSFKSEYGCFPESRFEWRELFGESFEKYVGWLLLYTDRRVFDVHTNGKSFELKVWNEDSIVCFSHMGQERLEIAHNDDLELLIDEEALAREVSKVLGFVDMPRAIGQIFHLGNKRFGRNLHPVFVCFDFIHIENLILKEVRHGEVPIFYCICNSLVSPKHKAVIALANGYLENLYDCFQLDESALVGLKTLEQIVDFKGTLKRNEQLISAWTGESPANPNWGMVEIRFEDPDYMHIRFGDFSRDMHYLNLPYFVRVNGKLKSVKKHWWFLASLCDTEIPYDYRAHKNYLPGLRKFLQKFFGIQKDPLPIENNFGDKSIRPRLKIESSSQVKRRISIEGF